MPQSAHTDKRQNDLFVRVKQCQSITAWLEVSGIQTEFDIDFVIGEQSDRFIFCRRQIIGWLEYAPYQRLVLGVVKSQFQIRKGKRITGAVAQQGIQGDLVGL